MAGQDPRTWLASLDATILIVVVLFLATLLGIVVDFAMVPVEKSLLVVTKVYKDNPSSKQWSAAWQRRWKSSGADSEFRSYEGIVSVARAYFVHSVLAAILWCVLLRDIWGITVLIVGLFFAFLFVRMWMHNTRNIFLVVKVARAWETKEVPDNVKDQG